MPSERKLSIVITGEDRGAAKTLRNVSDEVDTTGGKLVQLGSKVSPAIAAASAAVVAGVGFAMKGAFDAAVESQKISRETERVIQTTGASAWTSAGQISSLAESLSDLTGADDELVQSTANLLLTFTNVRNEVGEGNDVFDQATGYALDLAAVMGTDAASAAVQLGKALNDPIGGMGKLSKAGVSFSAQQKEQIRTLQESGDVLGAQKVILEELGKEFGGAAAAAKTPLDDLKVKVGNLQESLGAALIPAVSRAADVLGFLVDSFQALPEPVKNASVIIGGIGAAALGVVPLVAKIADTFSDILGPAMKTFRGVVDNVSLGIGELMTKMGASQQTGANVAAGLASSFGTVVAGALGVATVALIAFSFWQRSNAEDAAEAAKGQEAYVAALNEQNGALSDNVKIATAKLLKDKAIADNLIDTSANLELLGDQLANSDQSFEQYRTLWNSFGQNATDALGLTTNAADAFVGKLAELADAGDPVAQEMIRLKDAGQLNNNEIKDLVLTFDDLQDQYEGAQVQGDATARVMDGMAGASNNAAAANQLQIDTLKRLAEELRAQTDPYFAAFKAQGEVTKSQEALNEATKKYGPNSKEARDAALANAQASLAYKGELLELKGAQADGAGSAEFVRQMENLKDFGFDPTAQAARNLTYDVLGMGNAADAIDGKTARLKVELEAEQVKARLDFLRSQIDPATGLVSLGDIYAMANMYARGGMVEDGPFIVGENGPELGMKIGDSVRIFSNPETRRMLEPVGASASVAGDTVNVYVNNSNASPYDIGREVLWSRKVAG